MPAHKWLLKQPQMKCSSADAASAFTDYLCDIFTCQFTGSSALWCCLQTRTAIHPSQADQLQVCRRHVMLPQVILYNVHGMLPLHRVPGRCRAQHKLVVRLPKGQHLTQRTSLLGCPDHLQLID